VEQVLATISQVQRDVTRGNERITETLGEFGERLARIESDLTHGSGEDKAMRDRQDKLETRVERQDGEIRTLRDALTAVRTQFAAALAIIGAGIPIILHFLPR
jgi:hypothetical protein